MKKEIGHWQLFYKRSLLCFMLIVVLLFVSVLRIGVIATSQYSAANGFANGFRIKVANVRGTIYDCNGVRLTNSAKKILAVVPPTPKAVTELGYILEGDDLTLALERLKSGKPIVCEVPEKRASDEILYHDAYTNENSPTRHIIGYTDSENKGVSGLEKAFDEILYEPEGISVFYESDANERILEGVSPVVTSPNTATGNGVFTTLDINIQQIAEKHAQSLQKGSVLIAEAQSGNIKAMVSLPSYKLENLAEDIASKDSPLLNRSINAYNVGSVFKPLVAGVAIENGYKSFSYTCTGSCEIIDRYFKCHKIKGHGKLKMRLGLAHSCNTFFYNLAFKVGGDNILKSAKILSMDQSIRLCKGISTAKGNLPSEKSLENIARLANLSIGQGELLLSPVSILPLYCAIATDGSYRLPAITKSIMQNGNITEIPPTNPTRVFSPETASLLREYLTSVLKVGTGKKATPKTVTAAGKTATAQTGKFKNGTEICEAWFCGFFPAENPEYVVVIFSEDHTLQSLSCGEIFALIADDMNGLGY